MIWLNWSTKTSIPVVIDINTKENSRGLRSSFKTWNCLLRMKYNAIFVLKLTIGSGTFLGAICTAVTNDLINYFKTGDVFTSVQTVRRFTDLFSRHIQSHRNGWLLAAIDFLLLMAQRWLLTLFANWDGSFIGKLSCCFLYWADLSELQSIGLTGDLKRWHQQASKGMAPQPRAITRPDPS